MDEDNRNEMYCKIILKKFHLENSRAVIFFEFELLNFQISLLPLNVVLCLPM